MTSFHFRSLTTIALLLAGCGSGSSSGAPADVSDSGDRADGAGTADASSQGDSLAPTIDGSGGNDGASDTPSAARGDASSEAGYPEAGWCPSTCPSGQILVDWNLGAPGFPGPSGCACQAIPCPDGGIGCDPGPACSIAGHATGCSNWSGATLYCNGCG